MIYLPKTMLRARLRLQTVYRWSAVKMSRKQTVAEHNYNVMVLLKMVPLEDYPSVLNFALIHEDDEAVTGIDIPSHIKSKYRMDIDDELKFDHDLSDHDYKLFKFVDTLEAWLFCVEHCVEAWKEKFNILTDLSLRLSKYSNDIDLFVWLDSIMYKKIRPQKKVVGKKFGGATVYLDTGGRFNGKNIALLCKCNSCGEFFIARKSDLIKGKYKSCGCLSTTKRDLSTKQLKTRLLSRISRNPISGCWEWNGSLFKDGYGRMTALDEILAHRVSYRLYNGDIEENMLICHTCDNPRCVNPDHLFQGTGLDNAQDCVKKGRHSSEIFFGEKLPHKLSETDVKIIRELDLSCYRLAEKFDVAPQTISKIKNNKLRKRG